MERPCYVLVCIKCFAVIIGCNLSLVLVFIVCEMFGANDIF